MECQIHSIGYTVDIIGNEPMFRVEYALTDGRRVGEWLAVESEGKPRHLAELWWTERAHIPMPLSAQDCYAFAASGGLREPQALIIEEGTGGVRITGYRF